MRSRLPLLTLLLWLGACTADPAPDDAGRTDAGRADAAAQGDAGGGEDATDGQDAAPGDGGGGDRDATVGDGGGRDAGRDAGVDAGSIDGGFLPSFTQRPIDTSFTHGQAVTIVDIDDDGDLDVLTAISLDDTVRLHLNNGGGSSFDTVEVAQPGTIVAMHAIAVDLDGDADLDVAAVGLFDRSRGFGSPGQVAWYENTGDVASGWVTHPITGLTFWGPRYLAAGDLTGDGAADLVVGALQTADDNGTEQGNGIHLFRNTGGAFEGPTAIDATLRGLAVVLIHDVDGNGVLDVIAAGNVAGEIAWYENQRPPGVIQTNPTFLKHTLFSISSPGGLALAQADADPELELIATGDNGSGGLITWLDPPADPRSPWTSHPIAQDFGAANAARVAALDLNLDGRIDVAASSNDAAAVRAYLDDGAGGWIERTVIEPFEGVDFVAGGDIDGDGIPDLVTTTYSHDPNFDRVDWWRTRP